MLLAVFALLFGASTSLAQRPSDVSICDYYTELKYGSATKDDQFQLIQGIVSLAFGGSSALPDKNVSEKITGILNPGVFDGTPVDLLPWFNGRKPSTNLNNQPVGINWLDDGGAQPLIDFLGGETKNVILANTTNEYRLFGHFFVSFARLFGCSKPPQALPSSGGPLSLAYVHKFMSLNYTHLGYFIDQLTMSIEYWGFSQADSQSLNIRMNSQYNVRCAPPVTFNPQSGPQLLSLCQDPTCPLAVPNADCNAYVNLTANGVDGSSSSAMPSSTTSTAISITDIAPTSTSTSSSSSSPTAGTTAAVSSSSNAGLSTGGIAGVAVGGAAVLAFLAAAILFYRRKRKPLPVPAPTDQQWSDPKPPISVGSPGFECRSPYSEHGYNQYSPGGHGSFVSNAHTSYIPPAEMDSSRVGSPPVELSGDAGRDFDRMSPLQR